MLAAAALDPEIGALLIRIDVLELRVEKLAVAERHVGRARVAAADAGALAAEIHAVGAEALAARCAGVDDGAVAEPARRFDEDAVAGEVTPAGDGRRGGADRANDGVAELLPRLAERDAEALARRHVDEIWNEIGALLVDELAHAGVAPRLGEIVDEERAVGVRRLAEGILPLGEARVAEAGKAVIDRGGARDHAMLGSLDASGAGQPRLLVDGESFGEPRRRVEIRKERGGAAEDMLADEPQAAGAIEMEDVGELVGDDELSPVVGVAQRRLVDGRIGVDDDAIRRIRRGVAVREIDIVGEDDVDHAARGMQLLRQLGVRTLGVAGDAAGEWF